MEIGLYRVCYRPEEQLKGMVGRGSGEMIVPLDVLTQARKRAVDLPTHIDSIHNSFIRHKGNIEKELFVLHRDVVIVVPTVDNITNDPMETYRENGWPGLLLQTDSYFSLARVACELGNLPIPCEDMPHLRKEVYPTLCRALTPDHVRSLSTS